MFLRILWDEVFKKAEFFSKTELLTRGVLLNPDHLGVRDWCVPMHGHNIGCRFESDTFLTTTVSNGLPDTDKNGQTISSY